MSTDSVAVQSMDRVLSAAAPQKAVLMIAYAFPPEAYVGSRRTLKYCRYLREYGWRSIVVTIKPRPAAFQDAALCRQLPDETVVLRTWDLDAADWLQRMSAWWRRLRGSRARQAVLAERGEVHEDPAPSTSPTWVSRLKELVVRALLESPDPHILWVPIAFLRGARVLLTQRVDVIYSSSPPHSAHVAAFLLAKCFGKPHVVDFRDPWIVGGPTQLIRSKRGGLLALQDRAKKAVVGNAAKVVVVTPGEPPQLQAEFPWLQSQRIAVITNGYDSDDFVDHAPKAPDPAYCTLTHTGTIYGDTGQEFFEALETVIDARPELRRILRVNLVGINEANGTGPMSRLMAAGVVRMFGSQPHRAALRCAQESDVLLLFARGGTDGASHIPAKVFEYLFIGKPILAIAPPGVLSSIVAESGLGIPTPPGDVGALANAIRSLVAQWQGGGIQARAKMSYISRFERRRLTGAFAAVLDEARTP